MVRHLKVSPASVVVIALAVVAVALLGSYFSVMNRDWYEGLRKPSWQPPNWAFPVAWNTIFLLCIASITLIWNCRPRTGMTYVIMGAFVLNGILNVLWSALFFGNRLILPAAYEAGILCLTVVFIMIAALPISRLASLLLLPYALWTAFATYLTAVIYRLNT